MMRPAGTTHATDGSATRFAAWSAERIELEAALDRTPEGSADLRERLLERAFELEQLILNTPCGGIEAIRAKVRILRLLMEMAQADELPAMREIEAFLEQTAWA
jgi:hypothetical protein